MGEVYAGEDTALDRPIAVKFLAEELCHEAELVNRFLREAKAAAQLDHPNLVPVYAAGRFGTRPFFVMRHVKGRTLAEWIESSGRLPLEAAIDIAVQVCDGLAHVHAHRCIHRDIKPQNIMVEPSGRCVILDFGILRRVNQTVTSSGIITGTPAYIAPEQASDPKTIDSRSDLYSLGVTLFEMLTAELPFRAENPFQLLVKHQTEPPPRPSSLVPEIPESMDAIVLRLLAKHPDQRFVLAKDVREALVAARDHHRATQNPDARGRIAAPPPNLPPPRAAPMNTTTVPDPVPKEQRARPRSSVPDPAAVAERERKKRAMTTWAIVAGVVAASSATAPLWWKSDAERTRGAPPERSFVEGPSKPSAFPTVREPTREESPAPPLPRDEKPAPASAKAADEPVPSTRGRLTVSTMPPGAMLRIEGQSAQRTPYSLSLAAGQYRIELELEHHERHVETARVEPGRTERVHAVLKPKPATLEIVTTGTAGTVSIDGVVVGQGERVSSELPPGSHEVRVQAGRQRAAKRVDLKPGERQTVEFALEKVEDLRSRYVRRRR
jgi:serine/threonine protein kinase